VCNVSANVIEHRNSGEERGVRGSLVLRTEDNKTKKFHYDTSSLDCRTENLPGRGLKVLSLEVSSSTFTVFNRKAGRGRSKRVSSQQYERLSAGDIGFSRVRSVRREGCTRLAGLSSPAMAAIVLSTVACSILVATATMLLLRRRRMATHLSATQS